MLMSQWVSQEVELWFKISFTPCFGYCVSDCKPACLLTLNVQYSFLLIHCVYDVCSLLMCCNYCMAEFETYLPSKALISTCDYSEHSMAVSYQEREWGGGGGYGWRGRGEGGRERYYANLKHRWQTQGARGPCPPRCLDLWFWPPQVSFNLPW